MDGNRSDSREQARSGKGKAPFKGPPTRPQGYKPVCSIPAKFETILFKGPRESKGFGSEGRRFGSSETDNPGPGTYTAPPPAIAVPQESSSKKGYGPLTSHAPRFKQRLCYTGPGPGAYDNAKIGAALPTGLPISANPTSSFHPKVGAQGRQTSREQALPGPGTYNPVETRQGTKLDMLAGSTSHKSAFKTPSRKLEYLLRDPEVPGPCSYTVNDTWDAVAGKGHGSGHGRGGTRSCTSSFAPKSTSSLLSMPSVMFLEGDGPDGALEKVNTGPGPGSYDMFDHKSVRAAAAKAAIKPSPAFCQPDYVDRFAQPLAPPTPNMSADVFTVGRDQGAAAASGKQGHDFLSASRAPGVSAPFKSRSAAHGEFDIHEVARAPGPCYYSPQPLQRKSFHLNARKAYMPGQKG